MIVSNITPNDLNMEQDQLLRAGSKYSLTQLYHKQIDLPTYQWEKYFKVDDVTDLFNIINGVLATVSENAYKQDKLIENLRDEIEELKSNESEVDNENENVIELQKQLENKQQELYNFVLDSNERLSFIQEEYDKLKQELDETKKITNKYKQERIILAKELKKLRQS